MSMLSLTDAPGGFVPRVALSYGADGQVATAIDPQHPLPISVRGNAVTPGDRSGSVVAGGTAQQVMAANPQRQGLLVQNLSNADLWISGVGPASGGAPSLRIAPGQLYESPAHGVPATAVSLYGAAAGQSFAAREW